MLLSHDISSPGIQQSETKHAILPRILQQMFYNQIPLTGPAGEIQVKRDTLQQGVYKEWSPEEDRRILWAVWHWKREWNVKEKTKRGSELVYRSNAPALVEPPPLS